MPNVHSTGNFDWHYWRNRMVRINYSAEYWLTCHILWDHNPYQIGRTMLNLNWYLQVSWSMLLDLSFDFNILWFITCSANFEKANPSHITIHMFRSEEWTDMCIIWFLQDTNLKKYLQGLISPTSQATLLVVSHILTNV